MRRPFGPRLFILLRFHGLGSIVKPHLGADRIGGKDRSVELDRTTEVTGLASTGLGLGHEGRGLSSMNRPFWSSLNLYLLDIFILILKFHLTEVIELHLETMMLRLLMPRHE